MKLLIIILVISLFMFGCSSSSFDDCYRTCKIINKPGYYTYSNITQCTEFKMVKQTSDISGLLYLPECQKEAIITMQFNDDDKLNPYCYEDCKAMK